MTEHEAAQSAGITLSGIRKRLARGWTIEQAAGIAPRPDLSLRPKTITDLRAYLSTYNRERRQAAKRTGKCIQCNEDDARPGRTKCADCGRTESIRTVQSRLKAA